MVNYTTFDLEVFFEGMLELFETKFNDCLTEINTSKALQNPDDIAAKLIPDGCIFLGTQNLTQIGNPPLFITYDFAGNNEITENVTSSQAEKITLNFMVNVIDNRLDNDKQALKHLLRYHRAMIKMVNKNQDLFSGFARLEVESVSPAVYDIAGVRVRQAGVNISMTIGY